jgi:disulfide bond formation protein DsbB
VFETLVVICALAGVGVAGHHVYTQFYPAVSCGIDVLQPIVDDLPLAKIFPLGFQVDGFCSRRTRRSSDCPWRNGRWWPSCCRRPGAAAHGAKPQSPALRNLKSPGPR